MNRFKKAFSVGMSAALLASLFTAIAAPAVFGAVNVTSVGNVPRGGSGTGLVFTFTESSAACLANAAGSLTVTIADSAAGATVSYTGTAAVSGPGSLGVTGSASGQVLTVNWTASDTLNVESITVSGLGIAATSAAALGTMTATLASASLACFQPGGTASGTIATGIGVGATSVIVNVSTPGCLFVVTGVPGSLAFVQNPESKAISAVSALGVPAPGQQTLTIAATASVHDAATAVSQATACAPNGVLAAPGTVVNSLIYLSPSVSNVFPGENNQGVASLSAAERTVGFLSVGTVVTFTISTAGVQFSTPPTIAVNGAAGTLAFGSVTLDAARTSASATVTVVSSGVPGAGVASFTLQSIVYDVAASVPSGTLVNVTLSLSGGKIVVPTSRANAQVGRIFNASAAVTNVNIGQNGQVAGLVTITEVVAGSFTDGTGPNNVFEICPDVTATFTSPGPSAFVTGGVAAGNLLLREGAVASPDNIVAGTPDPGRPGCFYWTVWTKSTVATTITIGSAAGVGPLVNVNTTSPAGTLNANLFAGSLASLVMQVSVTIANRVFPSQVKVTAVSQPMMAAGSTHQMAGNILIEETGFGQLKSGSDICIEIVPNQQTGLLTDVYMTDLFTADLPVATASGGVVINAVRITSGQNCMGFALSGPVGNLTGSVRFLVAQQSTTGTGKVTISNLHYSVLNDAASGPVQVNVWAFGVSNTNVDFQRIVSNAKVGDQVGGSASSRLGVTQTGAFTTSTKVAALNKYVTFRFDFGVAAAGDTFEIWGATKTGNDWSAFTKVTSRTANASGVVYYYIRQAAATWKSYRAFWVDGGTWSPARQARWL